MKLFKSICLACSLCVAVPFGTAWAEQVPTLYMPHDGGLGKSQDGKDNPTDPALGSISVAPEPETWALFGLGVLVMGFYLRTQARTGHGSSSSAT